MKTGKRRRSRASRDDSVGVEVEEVTAELLVLSACPEMVGIDGDAAAAPRLGHGHGSARVRVFCARGKSRGGGEGGRPGLIHARQGVEGPASSMQGGSHGGSVATVATGKMVVLRKPPAKFKSYCKQVQ